MIDPNKASCLCAQHTPAGEEYIRSLGGDPQRVACVECGAELIASPGTVDVIRAGVGQAVCRRCVPPPTTVVLMNTGLPN